MVEKKNRFYSQNFYDELHSLFIYYNQKIILSNKENEKISHKPLNFLHIKRHIEVYHFSSVGNNKFCLLDPLVRISITSWSEVMIIFITQLIFLKLYPSKQEHYRSCKVTNSYQSIVSFLENRLHYYSIILQETIVPCIHPESIIRKMRLEQLDSSVLHIFRQILYGYSRKNHLYHEYFHFYIKLLQGNCFNLIFEEIDQAIQQYCAQTKVNIKFGQQDIVSDKWNTLRFKKIWLPAMRFMPIFSSEGIAGLYTMHYSRYDYTCSYFVDGSLNLSNLMYKRRQRFLERRLGCSGQFLYLDAHKDIFHIFRWYFKTRISSYYVLTCIGRKSLFITTSLPYLTVFIPTNFLTKTLSVYSICNCDGYPLTKITWIRWDDIQIIRYFEAMYDDCYWTYNGVINYIIILTYLSYIIRYSCAKTLAFKHKRSLRFILEYNNHYKTFNKLIRYRKGQVLVRRLWHLDL
jgi:hypothetical protein